MSFDSFNEMSWLTEMAWKSAMIGGAVLLIAALLKRRSAGERSAVLRSGVALILLLPLLSFLLPTLPVVTSTVYETAQPLPLGDLAVSAGAIASPEAGMWDDPTPLIELAWLGGVIMVLLRLGIGLATLSRWTRNGSQVTCPEWRAAFARALDASGCKRPVRLLVSDAPSPMSWGWLKPVILLDRDTVRDSDEADAVLAHELAHVARRDWLLLILARLVVALFWFNPLMWLLERRLVAEAEEATDARALEHVEPGRYAQTLLSCAQQYNMLTVPAAGIVDAGLARRVKAILEKKLLAGAPDPKWIRAAVGLCAIVAAPIAALKPVEAIVRTSAPVAPAPPVAPTAGLAPVAPGAIAAPSAPIAPAAPHAPVALGMAGLQAAAEAPLPPAPPAPPAPEEAYAPPAPPSAPAGPRPPRAPRAPHDSFWSDEDSREIERAVREASAEAGRARAEAMRALAGSRDEIRRATELARVEARRGMAEGASGMEEGARGMEDGARHMESEADKLRSQSYRAEQIAKAARDGRTVTDQQLLAMIPKMHEGAEKMRRGAERMRRGAERMRSERAN